MEATPLATAKEIYALLPRMAKRAEKGRKEKEGSIRV